MNVLTVAGIVPGPRYSVEATLATGIGHDGTAGRELPVRVWRYQGVVSLDHNREFRGMIRLPDVTSISFFLPDSLDHRRDPQAIHTELGVRQYVSNPGPAAIGIGPTWAETTVVDDPRGGEGRWLQTQAHIHGYGVATLELNYRIEVVTSR